MLYLERWKLFKPKFKDIWKVDISIDESIGHEQSGTRPCLIISFFKEAGLTLVIPLTSNLETKHFPYTVKIEKNPMFENIPEGAKGCPYTCPYYGKEVNIKDTKLPISDKLCEETVVIFHQVLLSPQSDMDDIVAAMVKIQENAEELL